MFSHFLRAKLYFKVYFKIQLDDFYQIGPKMIKYNKIRLELYK
jgi:hypothetical protein